MSFREKMKAKKKDLQQRNEAISKEETRKYGSIFLQSKIPKGVQMWRPGVGEHEIDIISFETGEQHPNSEPGQWHYVVRLQVYMTVGALNVPYVSPHDTWGDQDPIREWMASKGRLPTEVFKKVAPKERAVFLIWCHDTPEEEEKGIQIWETSEYNSYEKMEEQAKLPRGGGHIIFANEDKGGKRWFFEIVKEGTYTDRSGKEKEGTKFKAFKFIERPEGEEAIPDKIMDKSFPLDEVINMHPDYDEMYKAHHGQLPETTEELTPGSETQTADGTKVTSDNGDEPNHIKEEAPPSEEDTAKTEAQRPARRAVRKSPPTAKKEDVPSGTCPHGHTFGSDNEQHTECQGCPVWQECSNKEVELMDTKKPESSEQEEKEPEKKEEKTPPVRKRPPLRRKAK